MKSKKKSGAANVVLYTAPSCTWCRAMKSYLDSRRVTYRHIDVSKNRRAASDIVKRTGQMSVPVLLANNKTVVGFDKKQVNRLLGLK